MEPGSKPNGGVTWRWVAALAMTGVVASTGYSYRTTDQRSLTNTEHIEANREKIAAVDVDLQQEKVRNALQYREIERRLSELQTSLDELKTLIRRYR
jgi:hypothetical protein